VAHTLLLADDSVTIQRVIELTFADEDIKVLAVGDGDQAIAAIDKTPPDIVLADIGMPGRTGYEVAEHIRTTPRLSHIPVLLLTGAFEPVDQTRVGETGAEGVLSKPFEPQLVIARVKELLARSRSASSEADASHGSHAEPPAEQAATARPAAAEPSVWTNPFSDFPIASPAATPSQVDNYFDQLDQAFASLTASTHVGEEPPTPPPGHGWFGAKRTATEPADLPLSYGSPQPAFEERRGAQARVEEPPAEASSEPPTVMWSAAEATERVAEAAERPSGLEPSPSAPPAIAPAAAAAPAAVEPRAEAPPASPAGATTAPEPVHTAAAVLPAVAPAFPPLVHAFTALLAAEQSAANAAEGAVWPGTEAGLEPPPVPEVDIDAIVEQTTRRVLEQLSDRVVRETVSEIVGGVAERLIREEIERIKSALK
jgi:CheY-like chemotaxis protein